ncbi:AAA family ATPase [Streptomyces sp. CRN 30]|uniref:AAA family ATPase n=1 Tax=Streptomyces sp. CRN 30 TaxID=3075613 RepID=UPI002A7F1495|nr:AAA family ATPase [Streptomyces sp. CRN 30]
MSGGPRVLVVTGIPGSGKSTVGALLARRFEPAVLIEGDVLRRMVVTGRAEMTPDPSAEALRQYGLRLRHLAALTRSYHAEGFTVIAEDNLLGARLEGFVRLLDGVRPCHVVVLAPPPETVLGRDAGRARQAYDGAGWGAAELDAVFRRDTARVGLWLDTAGQKAEETAGEILERLAESALP